MTWFLTAIFLWFSAIIVIVVSLFTPKRCKPSPHDRNSRGFPLRLTLWGGAGALTFLSVITTIIASQVK